MMSAAVSVVAAHKTSVIITSSAVWLVTNLALLAQIDLPGAVPQVVVYGVGVASPLTFGWFLWRQFLKAQNETEQYLKLQVGELRSENVEFHTQISTLRHELSTSRTESSLERTKSAHLTIELAKANRILEARNPDLLKRVRVLEDNPLPDGNADQE